MLKKLLAVLLMLSTTLVMAAVDVNKATDAQLDSVKGIGPVTSKLILSERKKGEFKDWQDFIDRVKGIGEGSAARLSENGLTINGTSYKAVAATSDKKDAKAAKDDKKDTKATAKAEAKADGKDAKADAAKPAASMGKK